jgi:serine/threonine protein kinase
VWKSTNRVAFVTGSLQRMNITVHLQNQTYGVTVDSNATIEELRSAIEVKTHIPTKQQILDVEIKGECVPVQKTKGTCVENGIEDGSNILLSVSKSFLITKPFTTFTTTGTTTNSTNTATSVSPGITKNTSTTFMSTTTSSIVFPAQEMFESYDCEELCKWLGEMKLVEDAIQTCRENQLDGMSLLGSTYGELVNDMKIRPGAAKKLSMLADKIKNASPSMLPITNTIKKTSPNDDSQDNSETTRQQKLIKFEELKLGKLLGQGGESSIFVGVYFGEEFATKRLLRIKSKELDTILLSDDPCLMKCHYWTQDKIYVYYLMDYMDSTLDDAIYGTDYPLSDQDRLKIIQDIVHGCKVLHSKSIIHKDLKPANVLLRRNTKSGVITAKISDFGISKSKKTDNDISQTNSGLSGTVPYLPLEFLQDHVYGYFTDVYAFGIICFEIFVCERPWSGCNTLDEIVGLMRKGNTVVGTKRPKSSAWGPIWVSIMMNALGPRDDRFSFEKIDGMLLKFDGSKLSSVALEKKGLFQTNTPGSKMKTTPETTPRVKKVTNNALSSEKVYKTQTLTQSPTTAPTKPSITTSLTKTLTQTGTQIIQTPTPEETKVQQARLLEIQQRQIQFDKTESLTTLSLLDGWSQAPNKAIKIYGQYPNDPLAILSCIGAYQVIKRTKEANDLLEMMTKAGKKGYQSHLVRGLMLFFRKDYKGAMDLFQESEHYFAKFMIGRMYAIGDGVTLQHSEAWKYFWSLKDCGNNLVQTWIGWYLENGYGTEKNMKEALKWYQAGVNGGSSWAQAQLGLCYSFGKGVTQNVKEATRLYQLSAQQGSSFGMWCVGKCIFDGKGFSRDGDLGVRWIVQAAQHGSDFAKDFLDRNDLSH